MDGPTDVTAEKNHVARAYVQCSLSLLWQQPAGYLQRNSKTGNGTGSLAQAGKGGKAKGFIEKSTYRSRAGCRHWHAPLGHSETAAVGVALTVTGASSLPTDSTYVLHYIRDERIYISIYIYILGVRAAAHRTMKRPHERE